MRDSAGQRADGFHFLGLQQLTFEFFPFGDITRVGHNPDNLIVFVIKWVVINIHIPFTPAREVKPGGEVHLLTGQAAIKFFLYFIFKYIPAQQFRNQLADGGILVAPIGGQKEQKLVRLTREGDRFQENAS